ncbi:MAG: magnesium transporter [SAR324 cluster bacterium]|nr:magnesium transporter [SAR324 cluster bacterium]
MNENGAEDALMNSGMEVLSTRFLEMYPDEAAKLLDQSEVGDVTSLMEQQSVGQVVDFLPKLNPDLGTEVLQTLNPDFFNELAIQINPQKIANLMARWDAETLQTKLDRLSDKNVAQELQNLIQYPADSAGKMMDPRVTMFRKEQTVEDVLNHIRKLNKRKVLNIFVVNEENHLVGSIPLQEIAIEAPDVQIGSLIGNPPISILDMAPREEAVEILGREKLLNLPVIDINGCLIGVIRHDALVTAMQQEVSVNIQTMVGVSAEERAFSSVPFSVRKRFLWLVINLLTTFLAASVVGIFEDTIAKFTALAVLLPVVAGQSGNSGSQALAVIMRGLALREIRPRQWMRVMLKEGSVGFINGILTGVLCAVGIYFWSQSLGLALIIGLALVMSMLAAGLSGAAIPIILQTFKQDPAQASSIILTTVTDIVGFMSFLGLATLFSQFLSAS